jgi:hypothetical protein
MAARVCSRSARASVSLPASKLGVVSFGVLRDTSLLAGGCWRVAVGGWRVAGGLSVPLAEQSAVGVERKLPAEMRVEYVAVGRDVSAGYEVDESGE